MAKIFRIIILLAVIVICGGSAAQACTSMLVSAKASATGKPLMWKNRDTGTEHNFVERVPAKNGKLGYVALFDGGDTKLQQAWMGMNDAGFAIMNTASYNLQPDTARLKDLEGYLMSMALQQCRTVGDFERILNQLRKPLGVQANFGVMDSNGALYYYEVSDHKYTKFNVNDTESGVMIRTNFSVTGTKGEGYGYIRYSNVTNVLKPEIESRSISPEVLTEKMSRSFYHSLMNHDFATDTCTWVVDQDFVPRHSTSASVVIEGVNPGEPVSDMIMWTMLGYPPCSVVMPVKLNAIPADLRPTAEGFRSPLCNRVVTLKHSVFPINYGNGDKYINMQVLRPLIEHNRASSLEIYKKIRNPQAAQPQAAPADK